MKFNSFLLLAFSFFFFSACAQNTVISKNYDFSKMQRIGITRFSAPKNVRGIEDLFSKHLLANGYQIVDKNRIKEILKENNLGKRDYSGFKIVNAQMGQSALDVLLTGEITYFKPGREMLRMVETQDISIDDGTTIIYSNTNSDGSKTTSFDRDPQLIKTEKTTTPFSYNSSTEIGVIVKIIDLESLDVIWIGSISKSGKSTIDAENNAVKYLVKQLKKDIKLTLK